MRSRWKTAFCTRCNKEQPLVHNPSKGPKFVCAVCRDPVYLPSSRGAKPTRSKHTGALFPSREESKREPDLLAREQGGAIHDLRMAAWPSRLTTRYRFEVFGNEAVLALASESLRAIEILRAVSDYRPTWSDARESATRLERRVQDLNRAKHYLGSYRPDAEYRKHEGGDLEVEEVKAGSGERGAGDRRFVINRRLMLSCYGIEVRVIRGSGKPIFGKRTG